MLHSKKKVFFTVLVLGVLLIPGLTQAQDQSIGSIDLQYVLNNHPGIEALEETAMNLQAELEELEPEQQQQMLPQFQQILMEQEMQLIDTITEAAKEVAEELNLIAVLDSTAFFYGGVDISEQVIENLQVKL